jgi:membrane-associated phospholipid phosphatase
MRILATDVAADVPRHLILAAIAAGGAALLGLDLDFDDPSAFDRRIRRLARARSMNVARAALSPLFLVGLPGGFITIAHATAYWLRRKRRRGGPAIVTAAWLGWLAHRTVKLGYRRERPLRPGVRRRTDSYPSGHTTGTTALALTLAYVLRRERLVSFGRAAAIAIVPPAAMGAYRVIADDHWATDVIGGWLLGGAIAALASTGRESTSSGVSRRARQARRLYPT